jgi:biotin transporter BioY
MLLGEIYMKRSITKTLTFLALFTALMCVLSPFAIPMQPVPITLATLVVYIIAGLLDYKYAAIPVVLYILIGLMGVPVFSNGTAGLAVLGGPTAGFIYGYILGGVSLPVFNGEEKGSMQKETVWITRHQCLFWWNDTFSITSCCQICHVVS